MLRNLYRIKVVLVTVGKPLGMGYFEEHNEEKLPRYYSEHLYDVFLSF